MKKLTVPLILVLISVGTVIAAHYEFIDSEYASKMGMVHETDMNTYVRE